MRLNLGCGRMVLDGWFNVDVVANAKAPRPPEMLCDNRNVPLSAACADEVMAIHVLEHFYRWEVEDVLTEWVRLLAPGGRLILEMPDLELACRNVLAGSTDQMGMWPLYGDPSHRDPYMCHRWAWTYSTLEPILLHVGLSDVRRAAPLYHKARKDRDMRVEARKPL